MKKIPTFLLTIILISSMTACSNKDISTTITPVTELEENIIEEEITGEMIEDIINDTVIEEEVTEEDIELEEEIIEEDIAVVEQTDTEIILQGPYSVYRVIDGDTIVVNINDEYVTIRFIGMDTPEYSFFDESLSTEEGEIAYQYTDELLSNQQVFLEYDTDLTDNYGRTLAYVYLDDELTMVNELLLEIGLATTMTVEPNNKYADIFDDIQNTAKENDVGFWETGSFE